MKSVMVKLYDYLRAKSVDCRFYNNTIYITEKLYIRKAFDSFTLIGPFC